jgi:hypothetical protein
MLWSKQRPDDLLDSARASTLEELPLPIEMFTTDCPYLFINNLNLRD